MLRTIQGETRHEPNFSSFECFKTVGREEYAQLDNDGLLCTLIQQYEIETI